MEVKTWEQFAIWLGMQFPVLAASAVIAWWVVKEKNRAHAAELDRLQAKDRAVQDGLRDQIDLRDVQIRELKAEKEKLMILHYPSWNKDKGTGGGSS